MQLRNSQWAAGFYKAIILFPGVQLCPKEWAIKKIKKISWMTAKSNSTFFPFSITYEWGRVTRIYWKLWHLFIEHFTEKELLAG